ncbi:ferritin family protein [Candidatus Fermentibacterales bacterium]|nr:ferritin family protein [Candidatus Fermentibacterales bacterium]
MSHRAEDWKSIDDVLDFAIRGEEESRDFYLEMAGQMTSSAMASTFEQFAREETGHRDLLLELKQKGIGAAGQDEGMIQDLRISEYVTSVKPSPGMSYEDALVFAMQKEKIAFRLYSHLAESASDAGTGEVFAMLAREEARHKLRFELEYDDMASRSGN